MLKIILLLAAVVIAALLFVRSSREWLWEQVKAASDAALLFLLRLTSDFQSELTKDGKSEQKLWREQRLRNLKGLALRAQQRWSRAEK